MEVLGVCGFEWVLFDMEHYPLGMAEVTDCIRACEVTGTMPFVRVPANDPVWIKRILDAGAMGVLLPMLSGGRDARNAVTWARFPPAGRRPYGGGRVSTLYGFANYLLQANQHILVAVQIETAGAVQELDEMLEVPGIDVYFVGPVDLSLSLGLPVPGIPVPADGGEEGSTKREAMVQELALRIRGAGKVAGTVAKSAEQALLRIDQGYQMVTVLSDHSLLREMARSVCEKLASVR